MVLAANIARSEDHSIRGRNIHRPLHPHRRPRGRASIRRSICICGSPPLPLWDASSRFRE
eukprot:6530679-Prymnesium_polylepis.1